MADLRIDNSGAGGSTPDVIAGYQQIPALAALAGISMAVEFGSATGGTATFSTGAAAADLLAGDMDALTLKTNVANAFSVSGVRFSQGGKDYVVKASGQVHRDINPVSGNGTQVGTMSGGQGAVVLSDWPAGSSPEVTNFRGVAGAPINGADSPFAAYLVMGRASTAPLRSGSFSIRGAMKDGTTFNYLADSNGYINQPRIKGRINYTTGVYMLVGVTPATATAQQQIDLSFLGIPGVVSGYVDLIQQETLRYNATGYSFLPMDAATLGVNPIRLPSDGRVPIYWVGEPVVIGNTKTTAPMTVSNGQTIDVARTRLSRVKVLDAEGDSIPVGWVPDLEAGTVTFTNVSGYLQPVRIVHRQEDMAKLRDVQIDGTLTLMQPLTHDYEAEGTYVSSALLTGDLKARVAGAFDQYTWDGTTYSDTLVGDPAPASFNHIDFPITVTNIGAITQRWVLKFKTSTTFDLYGEDVGLIDSGDINTDFSPINPRTGEPYFTIPASGWGTGWIPGNILRPTTIGAMYGLWLARTTQIGSPAGQDYTFSLLARGDVNREV